MIFTNENKSVAYYLAFERDILMEIDLNGKIRFDVLLYTIYNQFGIIYKIVNADLEYINGNNFGNIQLLLKVNDTSLTSLDNYLQQYKLVSTKLDVIQKKEAS